ncbi:MAG: sialate O-acetylesterase [Candidatus Melainabacteria bacterium]|nr:sialate O-acetylesterase [Candidatus Melainabacteria bacterium]
MNLFKLQSEPHSLTYGGLKMRGRVAFSAFCVGSLLFLGQAALAESLKLPGVFSDHMVLQAGEPVTVYGSASPGEGIGIALGDRKGVAMANPNGRWQVKLPALEAGGPYELAVVAGQDKIVFRDVMVGQVWFCSGQSNMLMTVKQAGITVSDDALAGQSIRFITAPFNVAREPERKLDATWSVLDKSNVEKFSAVPCVFATELKKKLNGPIGIIVSAAPGSPVHSWISPAGLAGLPEGRSKLSNFEEQFQAFTKFREQKLAALGKDHNELEVWNQEADVAFEQGHNVIPPPPAASLYNAMISPFVPYAMRGVLWYQGEINVSKPEGYEKLFTTLMHDWRRKWRKPHMPFLFVQLPPAGDRSEAPSTTSKLARIRDAQAKASLSPSTYMVSAIDTIQSKTANWHDSDKQLIGQRLAHLALSTQYNKPFPFKGPTLDSAVAEGEKVRLRFRNTTHGLTMTGGDLKGFAVAGEDKKLVWAQSQIDGDTVIVWNKLIKKPSLVTYSWADNPDGNLYNGDKLPAIPFRAAVVHNPVK